MLTEPQAAEVGRLIDVVAETERRAQEGPLPPFAAERRLMAMRTIQRLPPPVALPLDSRDHPLGGFVR